MAVVYRTSSASSVLTETRAGGGPEIADTNDSSRSRTSRSNSNHTPTPTTAIPIPINSSALCSPSAATAQEYVLVSGQKYKLRRPQEISSSSADASRISMLSRALQDANKTIELQAAQLLQQNEYISQLETQLAALSSSCLPSPSLTASSPPVPSPCSSSFASPSSGSVSGLGSSSCVNRKKYRLQEAIQRTKELDCEPQSRLLEKGNDLDQLFETSSISPSKRFPSPALFIAHDNPQLGKIICDSFLSSSSAESQEQSQRGGMTVMIETKDTEGSLRILLGTLIYSDLAQPISSCPPSPISPSPSASPSPQSRGEQCLVCVDMTGFIFSLSAVERKILPKTIDILLSPAAIQNSIKMQDEQQLREFFRLCAARVDVILSPFHEGEWYPYWETPEQPEGVEGAAGVGTSRKLAPQFRSRGVGYLRLGDDMSSYGTSFLSADSLLSFFDNQPTLHSTAAASSTVGAEDAVCESSGDGISSLSSELQSLFESAAKWSDRCQHLKKITDILRFLSIPLPL
jgi:hypothetical protein